MHAPLQPIDPRRPARHWMLAFALGAILGALILGGGGRLAMRGITLWEGRPHQFTAGGTLSVLGFGVAFGVLGAGFRVAIDVAAERWIPTRASGWELSAVFALVCVALACVLLTPLTMHRLVLFPPVAALYVLALETGWRRWTQAGERTIHLAGVAAA